MTIGISETFDNTSSYTGEFETVYVDSSGFYDAPAVGMEELCYCVGAVSIQEEGIYATHVSPGEIGESPENIMEGFPDTGHRYVLEGVKSREHDPSTLGTVKTGIGTEYEMIKGEKFIVRDDGTVFQDF